MQEGGWWRSGYEKSKTKKELGSKEEQTGENEEGKARRMKMGKKRREGRKEKREGIAKKIAIVIHVSLSALHHPVFTSS